MRIKKNHVDQQSFDSSPGGGKQYLLAYMFIHKILAYIYFITKSNTLWYGLKRFRREDMSSKAFPKMPLTVCGMVVCSYGPWWRRDT